MEYQVLRYLVNAPRRKVKIADIAETFSATEEQVRGAAERLKDAGYAIAFGNHGDVFLTELTDVLDKNSIRLMLEYNGIDMDVVYSRVTGSTNADAKLLAATGFTGIVACQTQRAGRGRRGRAFQSAPGGVYFSYVRQPGSMSTADMQKVVLLVGVGVCDALEELGLSPSLKWPNDVYVEGKKICGILCEMLAEDNRVSSLIIGTGINVNTSVLDESIREVATSVYLETGRKTMRAEVIASVVKHCMQYDVHGSGYERVLERYRRLSNTIGKEIYVIGDSSKFQAKAVDVDESGFLVVETKAGRERIVSSDVSIR